MSITVNILSDLCFVNSYELKENIHTYIQGWLVNFNAAQWGRLFRNQEGPINQGAARHLIYRCPKICSHSLQGQCFCIKWCNYCFSHYVSHYTMTWNGFLLTNFLGGLSVPGLLIEGAYYSGCVQPVILIFCKKLANMFFCLFQKSLIENYLWSAHPITAQ